MEENKTPWQRIKGELTILVVLIPFIIVLGLVTSQFNRPAPTTPVTTSTPISATPTPTTTVNPSQSPTPVASTVTIEIADQKNNQNYRVAVTATTSVINVMNQAKAQGLQLITKDYGDSLGIFIESINGVSNDPSTDRYWNLYINGKQSPLGASSAYVKAKDVIRWVLEKN